LRILLRWGEIQMSNKKSILARILEEEQLQKFAQANPVEPAPPVVNEATITQATDTIFDQLFNQVLEEMGLNKLLNQG